MCTLLHGSNTACKFEDKLRKMKKLGQLCTSGVKTGKQRSWRPHQLILGSARFMHGFMLGGLAKFSAYALRLGQVFCGVVVSPPKSNEHAVIKVCTMYACPLALR